jgi:hypothetical protein
VEEEAGGASDVDDGLEGETDANFGVTFWNHFGANFFTESYSKETFFELNFE